MRRTALLLSGLTLALLATPAEASAATADSVRAVRTTMTDSSRGSARGEERLSDDVRAQVENHRALARAAFEAGRHNKSRREFLAAAELLRGSNVLPVEELYTVATLALADGRPLAAAVVMDTLAANAAAFGQPLVQAQALVEAVAQYAAAGYRDTARERYAALRTLLASPHIPDSFRSEVDVRIRIEQ